MENKNNVILLIKILFHISILFLTIRIRFGLRESKISKTNKKKEKV